MARLVPSTQAVPTPAPSLKETVSSVHPWQVIPDEDKENGWVLVKLHADSGHLLEFALLSACVPQKVTDFGAVLYGQPGQECLVRSVEQYETTQSRATGPPSTCGATSSTDRSSQTRKRGNRSNVVSRTAEASSPVRLSPGCSRTLTVDFSSSNTTRYRSGESTAAQCVLGDVVQLMDANNLLSQEAVLSMLLELQRGCNRKKNRFAELKAVPVFLTDDLRSTLGVEPPARNPEPRIRWTTAFCGVGVPPITAGENRQHHVNVHCAL